ncbi:MAG TPA: ATP-binding protein [Patescibacteria group bacterium]|nr:ATP-binding protein [Patescibacteria group bacterium]
MRYRLRNTFAEQLEKAATLTTNRSFFFRYGLVIASCAVASFVVLGSQAIVGITNPYLFLLAAVLLSALYGGTRPGATAFVYSLIFSWFTYINPAMVMKNPALHRIYLQAGLYIVESGIIFILIHSRSKNDKEVQFYVRKQAVIATIGQFGLEEDDLSEFMDRVVRVIAKTLDVKYCKIMELMPDKKKLRIKAGVGWRRGVVGRAMVNAQKDSQGGYTLQTNKPVIVTDLAKERRFIGSDVLHQHHIVSGISVVIPGSPTPYGILSIHSPVKRIFTRNDVNFMVSLATMLATTIQRQQTREELELIASLNTVLVSSLDPHQTLTNLVRMLVPKFADLCEVYIKENKQIPELVEVKGVTKEKERLFKEIGKKYPPTTHSKRPTAQVLQSGKAILQSFLPPTYAEDIAADEKHKELLKKLQLQSIIVVPIKIRHRTIGTIGFGTFQRGRIYTQRDLLIGKEIADRVAVVIDNARLYQQARNAIQARDEFLSIASHELKTPLTSMLLQLQAVLHSIKSESLASFSIDKTMEMLESTINQSKRLSRLVNDLLNISLITTGRLDLEREEVDLGNIVHDVVVRLTPQAEKAKSKITLDLTPKVVGTWDRIRLEQVVTNLLTNAIKYGNHKPIVITLTRNKKNAILQVVDHGLGIPKEQQEKIFDRFKRGTVNSSIKGLGVGLYLVNEIVKSHGGQVSVVSKPGDGSTFKVELPWA